MLLSLLQGLVSLMIGLSVSEWISPLGHFQIFPCLCPLSLSMLPLLTSAPLLALSPKPCRAKGSWEAPAVLTLGVPAATVP